MSAPIAPTLPSGALAFTVQRATGLDNNFVFRVMLAGVNYALGVMSESNATDNHAARTAYARAFLGQPEITTRNSLVWQVLGDLLTPSTVSDADLLTRVGAVWQAASGPGT